MTRIEVNGVGYNVEVSGNGPALLLLHGFTGDLTTWEPFVTQAVGAPPPQWAGFRTIRIDVIGHGGTDSPSDPGRYSMQHAVEDIEALLDELEVAKTALLGYSMGGRLALHYALARPQRLWGLVLESASPGIRDEEERASRRTADGLLADSITADGLEAFVDRWQAQPLFASQLRLPAQVQARQRQRRLAQSPLGLANSLRGMGAGQQDYLLPALRRLDTPALVIAGELDERYAALAALLGKTLPDALVYIQPGAGHAVHLEQPGPFARRVLEFLLQLAGVEPAQPLGELR